jgi:hypothetical protein
MHAVRGLVLDTDFEVEADPEKPVVVVLRMGKDDGSGYAGRCMLYQIEVSILPMYCIRKRLSRKVGKKEKTDLRMNGSRNLSSLEKLS